MVNAWLMVVKDGYIRDGSDGSDGSAFLFDLLDSHRQHFDDTRSRLEFIDELRIGERQSLYEMFASLRFTPLRVFCSPTNTNKTCFCLTEFLFHGQKFLPCAI